MRLDHYPEPVSPTGNIASEGIRNSLGRPDLDRLELLVRESVQNTWDARVGDQTVRVEIAAQECEGEQFQYLKSGVLAVHVGFDEAERVTKSDRTRFLLISDRGTSGLGGPLRADRASGDEPHDFVDFLRDIGQPPDKEFGGGTFGYGKTALYLTSRIYTIIVYSRCRHGSRTQSRFMVAALGQSFRRDEKKFTGRHWWGRVASDGFVDPLLDEEADEVARRLGLPEFMDGELGTTIAIVDPVFGQRSAREAMNFVVHALLWNFWPKMIAKSDGRAAMQFEVSVDGESIAVPSPETIAPFRGFVEAYGDLSVDSEPDAFGWTGDVECFKPQHHLGRLSLRKFPRQARTLPDLSSIEEDAVVPARCHHVALLREPELVVKYVKGPQLHSEHLEYGGVYRADRKMDRVYAKSEPPSHDDWVNKALEDWSEKRYVGATFRRIEEQLQTFAGPGNPGGGSDNGDRVPLGRLGEHLSALLPALPGPGARTPGPNGTGTSSGKSGTRSSSPRARVSIVPPGRLMEVEGQAVLEVEFKLRHASGSAGTTVKANPAAVLDSGEREREPPEGSPTPQVLEWLVGRLSHGRKPEIYVANDNGEQTISGTVRISVPADTSVGLELTATAEEDQA
ncbi:MAG: hypothetical protein ACR2KQ_03510 [Actinomycetota bacterium]